MLEIGTFFLRSETELVLKSRRVIPGRFKHGQKLLHIQSTAAGEVTSLCKPSHDGDKK
jgi:hypothetical protein